MKPMATVLAALALVVAIAPLARAQNSVSEATIREIESQVVMPRGARSLDLYDRYYAPDRIGEREVVVGVFLLRSSFSGQTREGVAPVTAIDNVFTASATQLPVVMDGGCNVVTIYFDVATQRLMTIRLDGADTAPELGACNGRA